MEWKKCRKCEKEFYPEKLNSDKETKGLKNKLKALNHQGWCLDCVKTAHANNFQGEWAGNNLSPGSLPTEKYEHAHWQFRNTIMWLEKYIEVNQSFSDWQTRKQMDNSSIKRTDVNDPAEMEKHFPVNLGFLTLLLSNPPWLITELKEEFYKWIDATGIKIDNCPKRLKHWLFGIHEMLEGRTEKFEHERKGRKREFHPNSPEYAEKAKEGFNDINEVLASGEAEKTLEEEKGTRFKGNIARGRQTFQEIAASRCQHHQNFHFFPQMSEEERAEYKAKQGDKNNSLLQIWRIESITKVTNALKEAKMTNLDLPICCQNWEAEIQQLEDIIEIHNRQEEILAEIKAIKAEKLIFQISPPPPPPKTNYTLWISLVIGGTLLLAGVLIWLDVKRRKKLARK